MYSRYAIGEIVLVVAGILIALSIDNANDIRKNEKVEEFPLDSSELFFRGFFTKLILSEDEQTDSLIIRYGEVRLAFKKTE